MPQTTATNSTVEPSTDAAGQTKPAELVVRYRYTDGILIEGKTLPYRDLVRRAQPRWRWFSSLRRWGMPRTRERVLSLDQVEEHARGLRLAGVPNVRVDYQEPRPEDVCDVEGAVETLEDHDLDGAEQLDGVEELDDAELLDEATAWLDRAKPLTAGHFTRWFPQSYRNAMTLVDDVRARHEIGLVPGPKSVLPYARAARDAVKGTAQWRSDELRELLDPSYPSYHAPKGVRPRPRKPTPAARRVLDSVGIDFGWEDELGGPWERDDDGVAPEILGERAARRAAAERARREHEVAFHVVDARALLEVCREAAYLGEVTPGRFNAAYQQIHPVFDGASRRRRALVLIDQRGRIEAKVRGPHGVEFSVSRPARTEQRAVVAALMRLIKLATEVSASRPKARRVDPTPKDTTDTHKPNADEDRRAQEAGAHATATGTDEPEAVVDVMGEIKMLVSMLLEESKHEATDVTRGSEDQEGVEAIEEGRLAGERVDAEERTIEDGLAGPEPRGEPAPGSLGMVEREGVALAADPGVGTEVDAPAEHVPPRLDVGESHPTVLGLAERGARRPPPDTSAPLLTQASSGARPSPAEDEAPPTAGDRVSPQGINARRPPPTRPIVRRAGPWRGQQACPRGLGIAYQGQAPPPTRRQSDGRAPRARGPPRPRGYARLRLAVGEGGGMGSELLTPVAHHQEVRKFEPPGRDSAAAGVLTMEGSIDAEFRVDPRRSTAHADPDPPARGTLLSPRCTLRTLRI